MHWKVKALIQNTLSVLPSRLSYSAYYRLQRQFGGLRTVNPLSAMRSAVEIASAITNHGGRIPNSSFLEVGTGRSLGLPITMWLLGADRITTVDLNPYLKYELICEDLQYIRANRGKVLDLFGNLELDKDRFRRLLEFDTSSQRHRDLLAMCGIEYLAPMDAANLPLDDASVTYHVSNNVCEHIPQDILVAIFKEGARVIDDGGLFVHIIDHSDHFAHDDRALSAVNFLRYNDARWTLLAGNRYMYMNRLRVDDFMSVFDESHHEVLSVQARVDPTALDQLAAGSVPLDSRFSGKPTETLATLRSLFVSKRRGIRADAA